MIASGVMVFVVYYLAIGKTIELRNQCIDLNEELVLIEDAPGKMDLLNSEVKQIENLIGGNNNDDGDFRQFLLEKTSYYCESNNVEIKEIPEPITADHNEYEILTHTIILKGDFQKLNNFIYEMEQKMKVRNITSVRFYIIKDLQSKKEELHLTMYFRNAKKKNSKPID
jgi:hypothetical protein